MPLFFEDIISGIKKEGSAPTNDVRYNDANIISMVNSRMKYFLVPLINELAVNFFVIAARVALTTPDGTLRFPNNIIPFPHRGVGRGLREVKWLSQGYEYKVPRKGMENDLVYNFYAPFVYDVLGEGIRILVFNNSAADPNVQASGDIIFYYAVAPSQLVMENISAPLVQVLYDTDNKVTYFTLNIGEFATDFPQSNQILTDIVSTKGKAYYATNCMIYYYADDFYGELDSNYKTYITDENIPWGDLDGRQTLGFRILNMPGEDRLAIYSTSSSDVGKEIGLQGYDEKSNPIDLNITLGMVPTLIDTSMRFLYRVSMGGASAAVGDIIIENSASPTPFRYARIPSGIINCNVGTVLPYETNDIYINKSGKSSFLIIPDEAVELLIQVVALNILQNQGDTEAAAVMKERVTEARKIVMNLLKDTVVGTPEVIRNDYGLSRYLSSYWTSW